MPETKAGDRVETPETAPKPRRITRRKAVEEHARSYFDALSRRDTAAMLEHWREDGVDDLVPVEVLRGRAEIGAAARGFVYTVSLAGTTGERDVLSPSLRDTVARVRSAADVPVAVGFGISTSEQASAVADLADGVIVGSRVVRACAEGGAAAVGTLVAELADAVR